LAKRAKNIPKKKPRGAGGGYLYLKKGPGAPNRGVKDKENLKKEEYQCTREQHNKKETGLGSGGKRTIGNLKQSTKVRLLIKRGNGTKKGNSTNSSGKKKKLYILRQ